MTDEEMLRFLSAVLVLVLSLAIGTGLFYCGLLRARYLIYGYLPLSLMLTMLVLSWRSQLLSTWVARLLFSIVGTTLIMVPMLVSLRRTGVDVDEWDRRRRK
jgi:hypothetical protein